MSSNSPSTGWQKQISSAALVRKARKISSDSSRSTAATNPFLRASSSRFPPPSFSQPEGGSNPTEGTATGSTATQRGPNTSGNPFFAQLAKKEKPAPTPFGENFTIPDDVMPAPPPSYQSTSSLVPPPSYASVVTGKGALQGSIPSFITHGPGSIPLGTKPEDGNEIRNLTFKFCLLYILQALEVIFLHNQL